MNELRWKGDEMECVRKSKVEELRKEVRVSGETQEGWVMWTKKVE